MSMRSIYRKIAKKYGVSAQSVKEEIRAAIAETYTDPNNNNEITKAYQRRVPAKGEISTPEELVRYAAQRVKEKQ